MEPTPLEIAVIRAHEFSAGIAAQAILQGMIKKSEECSAAMKDRTLPNDVRVEALKEVRHINLVFEFIATGREALGISA